MRHLDDVDNWGSSEEDIPLLGVNEGPRKVCSNCKKSKGLQYFSAHGRNADGLQSQCKQCRRDAAKKAYIRKTE
jgi:hypothetical protein